MYSITQDIENSEFNGWLNPEILIKNNRRQEGNRKRGYELANLDLNEECDDLRRRVLRPRHESEFDNNTSDASRTRPIQSNRIRQRQTERNQMTNLNRTEPSGPVVPDVGISQSNTSDLSLLQALAAYNWSQNYLSPHTDASFLHRIQQAAYPQLNNVHMSQRIPQFDPWVLHNYLLAASYGAASTSHVSPDSNNDDSTAAASASASVRMSQMAYPSMTTEMNRSNPIWWQYHPFFLNNVINPTNNRSSHELHTHPSGPAQMDTQSDLSYYFRDYSQRDSVPASNDNRMFQGMYYNDSRLSNFCSPMLSNPFPYASICPYHSSGHMIHNSNQSLNHVTGSGSTQSSEPASSQTQNTFNNFPHSSAIAFDHLWSPLTPIRPLNYSLNGSNIDTLLHLAAHFEQRKRGITKEELDKLPTHRYKAVSDKQKQKDKNSLISDAKINLKEEIIKCLVCLEEFESKQNIRVLRCDHEFHAKCIDKWLKINRTCPLCRADAFDGSAQKDGA